MEPTATGRLTIDREASTVTIDGRRFPAVGLICPPLGDSARSDWDRSLGIGDYEQVFVPAENGVLFCVGWAPPTRGLELGLYARSCEAFDSSPYDEPVYLPISLRLGARCFHLAPGISTASRWYDAEPDWVVETIDRLSRWPFRQPDGPGAQLVPLSHHFEERSLR